MLECEGQPLLSYPECHELLAGVDDTLGDNGVLAAWWSGEQIPPETLHLTFGIYGRLAAETPRAQELVERVLRELERLFPDRVPQP
jgi:hypothetical protein